MDANAMIERPTKRPAPPLRFLGWTRIKAVRVVGGSNVARTRTALLLDADLAEEARQIDHDPSRYGRG